MELLTFEPVVNVEENQLLKIEELEKRLEGLPGGSERTQVNYEIIKYRKQYKLRVLENDLKEAVTAIGENFLKIGALLVEIEASWLYTAKWEYVNIYDYAEGVLGLKRTTTKNLMAVSRTYCGGTAILNSRWEKYSYSQLVEMLPLTYDERLKISEDMTVKQIRERKQNASGQTSDRDAGVEVLPGQVSIDESTGEVKNEEPKETVAVAPQTKVIESIATETDCWSPLAGLDLKNDKEREEWLKNYASWGLYLEVPDLKLRYYRYRFPDQKVWFIVTEYWHKTGKNDGKYMPLYTLMYPDQPTGWAYFYPRDDSISTLREWLKANRNALAKKK